MADWIKEQRDKAIAEAMRQAAVSKAKGTALQESYDKGKSIQGQYLESVEKQAQVAEGAVGNLQEAQRQGLASTRAQTGKVLANSRGMLGGGRGMSMLRGAALDRGAAEGAQRAQYAGQIQNAMQDAARARSEAIAEQGKAQKATELEAQNALAASSKAEEEARVLAEDYVGWLSDANRREIAGNLRAKADKQATPAERAAWLEMADKVEGGLELGRIG